MTRFFEDTWLLLTLRWRVLWNGLAGRGIGRRLFLGAVVVWAAGSCGYFCYAIGAFAGALLLRFPELHLEGLLPGTILTAVALILFVSSFGIALGALFLSSDIEILMSAPVDRRAVFVSKILDGVGWYYAIIAVTAVPALFSYGAALGYGPLYYLLALLVLLGTPLLPAGLGALLVMAVARFAPARRVREVLGLVAILTGVSGTVGAQTARAWSRQLVGAQFDLRAIVPFLQQVARLPIPSFVAGYGLAAAGVGRWQGALTRAGGFLVLTFGGFAVCVALADQIYAAGWVRMQSSGVSRRGRERALHEAARSDWLGRAPASLALALKDWRTIPRDLRNFARLLSPLVILPAVYFNLLWGGGRRSGDVFRTARQLGINAVPSSGPLVAFGILFATVLVFGRIASTSISREGRAFWVVKGAPLSNVELLGGKLAAAAIPFVLLSTAMLAFAAVWLGYSIVGTLYGWLAVEALGLCMLAIDVGLSVPWARLDWDDPRRMQGGWGAVVTTILNALVLAIAGGLFAAPLLAHALLPSLEAAAWVVGAGGALAVCLAVGTLAIQFGSARLAAVGEE